MDIVLTKLGTVLIDIVSRFPQALKSLEEKRKEYTSDALNNGNFEDWNDNFAGDDEDEEGDEDIQQYMNQLKTEGDADKFISEDGFGDEGFDDLEEDPLTGSILDEVNIYEELQSSVSQLQQSDVAKYQVILNTMSADDQNVLNRLMAL